MRRWLAVYMIALMVLCFFGCNFTAAPAKTEPSGEATAASLLPPEHPAGPTTEPAAEPIQPATAPTDPAPEPEDDDFVRILDYIPQARQALAYATEDNFTGQIIYDFRDAYLRYGTVKKLAAVAEELEKKGIGLLVWDGYRPVYAQARLFEVCPDPAYVSPPGTGNQNHSRGRAVDLTLVDLETGEPLEMPTGFDDFSTLADRDYSDCSAEAAANAGLLEDVMVRHGFHPYSAEWWHYNDIDSYPIEEKFDPAKFD